MLMKASMRADLIAPGEYFSSAPRVRAVARGRRTDGDTARKAYDAHIGERSETTITVVAKDAGRDASRALPCKPVEEG